MLKYFGQIFLALLLTTFSFSPTFANTDQLDVVKSGLEIPWGMDFLPDGRLIFTEKMGAIKILDLKTKKEVKVSGVPKIKVAGQGGLLDIKVHPKFAQNNLIFISYVAEFEKGWTTHVARFELKNDQIENLKVLFKALPASTGGQHFGSRLALDDKDYLYITVGDRGERDEAQDLNKHMGKVLRIHADGRVPSDNPFVGQKNAQPEIWSYGHRNPQGLEIHPVTKELWLTEHGPRGGDEINLIQKGLNYGWPIVTYGREYWGPSIGERQKTGVVLPVHHWTPSIAPSGLKIYKGKRFPELDGVFISGALSLTHVNLVFFDQNQKLKKEERLFKDLRERFRSITISQEGEIYFGVDSGKILKVRSTGLSAK